MNALMKLMAGLSVLVVSLMATAASNDKPVLTGYTNTPFLPDSEWRVHDDTRPRPVVIDAGTPSTIAKAGTPPSDAIVLFDGTQASLNNWLCKDKSKKGWKKRGEPAPKERTATWKVKNGYMECNGTGAIWTAQGFGSAQYHVEFSTPNPTESNSQGRGNSGFFVMGQYEVQILDSYNNKTYADGQASALYGQSPPLVNASRKPGVWQMYDIIFHAPAFKNGKVTHPATITVFHNGVLVQDHVTLLGASAHKSIGSYKAHPSEMPLQLQDHGNPVRFRNIWVRKLKD